MARQPTGHKGEIDIRARLTSVLGGPVEQWMWALLESEGHTSVQDEPDFKSLVAKARYYRRMIPTATIGPPRTTGLGRPPRAPVREPWLSKTLALANYRAAQASRAPRVREFRRKVLKDTLLSEDEAQRFIRARSRPTRRATGDQKRLLAFPGAASVERVRVPQASVLGRLSAIANELCDTYRWPDYAATWFVLTGRMPLNWPIDIDEVVVYDPHQRTVAIRLVVAPWMPAPAILKAFIELQKKVTTVSSRAPSDRRLALLRFELESQAGTVRERLAQWNRDVPRWAYRDVRNFERDLKAARRQIEASDFRLDLA